MPTDINTIQAWASLATFIVTALTGFFIVQTFILQAKATAVQTEIVKIEQTNFRLKFLPKLHQKNFNKIKRKNLITETVEIEILENELKQMRSITYQSHDKIEHEEYYYDKTLILGIGFYLTFDFKHDVADFHTAEIDDNHDFNVNVTFEFIDIFDNLYRQTMVYKPSYGGFLQPPIYLGKVQF